MKTISDQSFLAWTAEADLVPDPKYKYPSSRQLVFPTCSDCWRAWKVPTTPNEPDRFVGAIMNLIDWPVRIRVRGGGPFSVAQPESAPERAIRSAASAAGIPTGATGALEFDLTEQPILARLAVAFLLFGYRVETDLEIVAFDRSACLMLSHHREIVARCSTRDRLVSFANGMLAAGYREPDEEDDG
jgi:hypothetical protein